MDGVHADETREGRDLLGAAFETLPAGPVTVGEGLLRAVRRRRARRRRALVAGGAAAAAGAAVALLLSATMTAATPALAAVSGALSRASAESFRMTLTVTQRNTGTGGGIRWPLHISGKLDLKRHLGTETLSTGWRTRIVGGVAYTYLPPVQARSEGTAAKPWTEMRLADNQPPYPGPGAQLAWGFNSGRPFSPQAQLALLRSGASIRAAGPVSGRGWTGTGYRFALSHPAGTGGLVDRIAGAIEVDRRGQVRRLTETIVFAGPARPAHAATSAYTLRFTFRDFGVRFSVRRPPAGLVNHDLGTAVQF